MVAIHATLMPDIVLATLNAKYIHAAFGLRYLLANLGELRSRATLAEFDINQRPLEVVESLLALNPKLIGFGVYIWNATQTTEIVALLKKIRPDVIIVLGGPEVSFEVDQQEIVRLADHVVTGEADLKFADVCRARLVTGESLPKVIPSELPKLEALVLPYDLYTDADIAHRVLYVEASRGCPFTCEFCLSSLDVPVRAVPIEAFLASLARLIERGARQFKFVDRTFNLNLNTSRAILEFFLAHWQEGMFVHFEMVPDRMPDALREVIARFPSGALQFEVGIQSFDEATSRNISRRQNVAKIEENFRYLRDHTGVHIHADLIVGLPGETVESFGRGFDRLVTMRPQEIQVGILKRLRGTPIVRHDTEWAMAYSPHPPYEILSNKLIDFPMMQRLRRFARFWDLTANSGNFVETVPLLWSNERSPFWRFLAYSDWVYTRLRRTHQIALATLAESLFDFLIQSGSEREKVVEAVGRDWRSVGRKEELPFLAVERTTRRAPVKSGPAAKRQTRHLLAG
jgi:radical SAM superfamily enzyme YgiQ (UPF0313 family)